MRLKRTAMTLLERKAGRNHERDVTTILTLEMPPDPLDLSSDTTRCYIARDSVPFESAMRPADFTPSKPQSSLSPFISRRSSTSLLPAPPTTMPILGDSEYNCFPARLGINNRAIKRLQDTPISSTSPPQFSTDRMATVR